MYFWQSSINCVNLLCVIDGSVEPLMLGKCCEKAFAWFPTLLVLFSSGTFAKYQFVGHCHSIYSLFGQGEEKTTIEVTNDRFRLFALITDMRRRHFDVSIVTSDCILCPVAFAFNFIHEEAISRFLRDRRGRRWIDFLGPRRNKRSHLEPF